MISNLVLGILFFHKHVLRSLRLLREILSQNLQQTHREELNVTLYQMRYLETLINKEFKLSKKSTIKRTLQKYYNEQPLSYISTYNKNNPEQFTEISRI